MSKEQHVNEKNEDITGCEGSAKPCEYRWNGCEGNVIGYEEGGTLRKVLYLILKNLQMSITAKQRIDTEKKNKTGSLDLSKCELSEIPQEVSDMVWLEYLNLFGNKIRKIEHLDKLVGLKDLILGANEIERIEGLDGLAALETLTLYENSIQRLEGLNGLESLWYLNCNKNRIEVIEGLDGLQNLKEVYLGWNQIQKIEGLNGLQNLNELGLWGNQIQKIEGLDGLQNLTELSLWGNQIQKIEGLAGLKHLMKLDLEGNQIQKIEGLDSLHNLNELDLWGNQIQKIEGLDGLHNLNDITLFNNKISNSSSLKSLTLLKSLSEVYLDGNPIEDLPVGNLNDWEAIKTYLLANDKVANTHVKLNILGTGRIGKTQLFNYFKEKGYEEQAKPTHGTNTCNYKLGEISATVWDFGGQSYHHGFHKLFIRPHDMNLVLWRNQQDEYPYSYWLATARLYSNAKDEKSNYTNPLLLCQNVWQETDYNEDTSFAPDSITYPNSTSVEKYGLGLEDVYVLNVKELFKKKSSWELRHNLIEETLQRSMKEHAGKMQIRTMWVKVKEGLDDNPIRDLNMTVTDFKEKYAKEFTESDYHSLLSYLEYTGTILRFQDNDYLKHYIFPNPPHLADWLYQEVLEKEFEQSQNGELVLSKLVESLEEEKANLFIKLMEEFELIFKKPSFKNEKVGKDEDVYIVPQFLPEYEHSFKQILLELLPFTFSLKYPDYIHEGRIFEFIAKYGKCAEDDTAYWKYGLLYKHPLPKNKEVKTLVYYHAAKRQVYVHIENTKGRSEVARIIFDFFVYDIKELDQRCRKKNGR